ncbi:disulfide bond formation protein B [Aquicella lusitana]|uniref:Disulfide bond formation protein DsbB n=1 Tax=Aquicella lusitana TaxID=254246 RepID=A0A370GYW9_9COXI|nr:disulfide bond formation protein B [Aquicella lusitana]RDI48856.1 disulfide bond formation protein DsbB [Aquicella lusitana]VVC73284.1 Disulfide bond formation protein B [Aquicella lusitana]
MIALLRKNIIPLVNFFELSAVIVIIILALCIQLIVHELPCPLCLLQRVGFLCMAYGFLMNFRFGFRPSHYSIVLVSGLYTCFVALRQIALHVIPGTGAYGSAILGFHLYTWSFIAAMAIVVITSLLLGVDHQFQPTQNRGKGWLFLTHSLFAIVSIIIAANIVSVILECGFKTCPDDPVRYELLETSGKV